MRYLFLFLLLIHGFIHVLGTLKAFDIGQVSQLTKAISRPAGIAWLLAAVLFVATAILYFSKKPAWPLVAFAAIFLSQVLIVSAWQDAKFGTLANGVILLVAVVGYSNFRFVGHFEEDVAKHLSRTASLQLETLTEADLRHLPEPVQRYLRYTGVVGKPKVKNMKVIMEGEMRGRGQDWFPFTSRQYNFFDEPARLFFMEGNVKGIPANGYHAYQDHEAGMKVKVLSLFPVVDESGETMFKAETVTVFNDMCLMAPATLIDPGIQWEAIDSSSAKAVFTHRDVSISATLYFDKEGRLIDFASEDRSDISDMKQYRFTTPVHEYQSLNGYRLIKYGEAVWHYPEGAFVYGKFHVKEVMYNTPY